MSKESSNIRSKEDARRLFEQEAIKDFCLRRGENLPPAVERVLSGNTKDATPQQQEFLNSLSMAIYSTVRNPKTALYEANANMLGVFENEDAARKLANSVLPKQFTKEDWHEKNFVAAAIDKLPEEQKNSELTQAVLNSRQLTK